MLKAGEKFTDQERDGLSDDELAVLEGDDDSEALKKIAGEDDADADADVDADAEDEGAADAAAAAKEAAAKEAAAKAKEEAEAKAAAAAEAKAKQQAETKIKAAADAAAEAAKKAGADAEAQAKARKDAEEKARTEAAAAAKGEEVDETDDATVEVEDDADELFMPTYIAPAPENYEARIKELDKRHDEATSKFQKGTEGYELTNMLADHRSIERDRAALEGQMQKHQISVEQAQQAGEQRWKWEVNRFMRDVKKHEGIDYADSLRLNGALDAHVKTLANKPEHADKPGDWFLREAHKLVKAELKLGTAAPADKGAAAKAAAATAATAAAKAKAEAEAKAKAAAGRKSPTDKLPKTLGGLPAAGGVDLGQDGEGEFSEVNSLMEKGDSLAVEAYIAGKSPEWQDRWARLSN